MMARAFLASVTVCATLAQAQAASPNYCDNKRESGESVDGKAMMMAGAITAHLLAERYCRAKPEPLWKSLVVVEEWHGCGPRSKLEAQAKKQVADAKRIDPTGSFGMESELSKKAVNNFGGCSELLKNRREILEKYEK